MKCLSMLAILIFARTTFAEPTAAKAPPSAKPAATAPSDGETDDAETDDANTDEAKAAEAKAAEAKAVEAKSPEAKAAVALVSRDLIEPLATKERTRSRFSRARLPPQARRVRVLDEQPHKDTSGRAFVRFAVDARHGFCGFARDESAWRPATITGCVYLDKKQIFVASGEEFRPAAFLLGKRVKAAAESTCRPEAAQLAHAN